MTQKQLIEFGNYLLSDERKKLINEHPELTDQQKEFAYSEVSHADIKNFKSKK